MLVTDIIKNDSKKSKKVKVILDDSLEVSLYYGDLRTLKIKKGVFLEKDTFIKLEEILYKRALNYCYHLLGKKDYTTFEIKSKLTKTGYPEYLSDKVCNRLVEMRLLNDEDYTERYIRSYIGSKGIKWIKNKLYQKGIKTVDPDLYSETVSASGVSQEEALKKAAHKWWRTKPEEKQDIMKLKNFLYRKGFEMDAINRAISEFSK